MTFGAIAECLSGDTFAAQVLHRDSLHTRAALERPLVWSRSMTSMTSLPRTSGAAADEAVVVDSFPARVPEDYGDRFRGPGLQGAVVGIGEVVLYAGRATGEIRQTTDVITYGPDERFQKVPEPARAHDQHRTPPTNSPPSAPSYRSGRQRLAESQRCPVLGARPGQGTVGIRAAIVLLLIGPRGITDSGPGGRAEHLPRAPCPLA